MSSSYTCDISAIVPFDTTAGATTASRAIIIMVIKHCEKKNWYAGTVSLEFFSDSSYTEKSEW